MRRSAGPFEILEILGEGSFGTVCVARVTGDPLKRRVALKILKGTYIRNQKILNRTRDEARLLSRIAHPNIVRVERLMEVGGRPVVVMEYVRGVSLDQLLLRYKDGMPGVLALEAIRHSCMALHVAYNEAYGDDGRPLRVIHRDIKPSNIMLNTHGEVKVLDFGIARGEFEGREAETESVVMGSRPYMAPERLDGVADSPSVDVYSAGMTLFEMLTGRTMSLSINPVAHEQAMNRQLSYLTVAALPPPAMEDLRDVIRRMCAYDRDYRPSAIEVARDLELILESVHPSDRIDLKEFARSTVLPIYESRPRIAPEDAIQHTEDGEFLKEVTGQLTASSRTSSTARSMISWSPYVFVAGLAFVVVFLGALATFKVINDQGVIDIPVTDGFHSIVPEDGKVRVMIWFPGDAQAQVGSQLLTDAGHARIFEGPTVLEVYFDGGPQLECRFEAREDTAVRVFEQGSVHGITVDDGPFEECRPFEPGARVVPEAATGAGSPG